MVAKRDDDTQALDELRRMVAMQQRELAELRRIIAPLTEPPPPSPGRTRRDLLKLAGAGMIGAAGATALLPKAATAASGGDMVIGEKNASDTSTQLELTADSSTAGSAINGGDPWVFYADAMDPNHTHVVVDGVAGGGVNGGTGVAAYSDLGWDLFAAGTGRLAQWAGLAGIAAPAFPGFTYNANDALYFYELLRGMDGELWTALNDAAQYAAQSDSGNWVYGWFWRRVNSPRFDLPDGSGNVFTPQRAIDTRINSPSLASSTSRAVPIAQSWNGSELVTPVYGVPSNAVGIAGNLTAVNPSFNGYLTIYPTGAPRPGTSTVNFVANGPASPNGFIVGLGDGGSVSVYAGPSFSGQHVDFIIDVTAYFQ